MTSFIIQKQVVRVEKLVGERNKFRQVAYKKKIALDERKRFEEKEKRIEDRQDETEKQVSNKIPVARLGILDVIKNFIFKTLLGAFVIKLLPHLPKLKGVLQFGLKATDFLVSFSGSMLNAMVTFVDKVYKIVDFGKQQAKLLGGDKGLQNYNKALDMANKVMNSMFIAAMLFSDLAESDADYSTGQQAVDTVKDRVVQQAGQRAAQQAAVNGAARVSAASAAGIVAGVGLLSSALGEGAFQLRKFTTKIQKDADIAYSEAQNEKNPFMRFIKSSFFGAFVRPGMMFTNFLLNGLGTLLDVVGAPFRYATELINFGVMFLQGDSDGMKLQRENLGKFDARIREQIREMVNTLSFGTLAKERGSFGSLFGSDATKAMGYASGGEVTRAGEVVGGVIGRTVKKQKVSRVTDVPTSPLIPGVDADGMGQYKNDPTLKNIDAFFPNPKDPKYINSNQLISRSYDVVSSVPFLSPLLETSIKILMGDAPSSGDYNAIGVSLNNFISNILDKTTVPGKKNVVSDEIGSIDISNWARKAAEKAITNSASSIIDDLSHQFSLKMGGSGGEANPSAQKGPGAGDNPLAKFGGEAQFVIGDSIAHGFAGRSGNGSETSDTQVGRSAANVLKILQSKGDSLKGMLVDLSTGIANSPGDLASVESQLSYLKSIGARVRVLGVAHPFSKENGGINEKLEQLVKRYGFYFYGGYKGSADKVHGTATDYAELKEKVKRDAAQTVSGSTNSLVPGGGLKGLTDADWNELAYIVSGEAGPGDDVYGVAANVLTRVASPAWPNTIREVGRQGGQYEAVYKGLARYDAKLAKQLKDNQGKIASALRTLNGRTDFKGQTELGNRGAGDPMFHPKGNFYHYSSQRGKNDPPPKNPDQSWKKWIAAAFHGGYVDKTQDVLTHPGEYVVDADSVSSFGKEFYDIINQTETATQRKNAANRLVQILSQYTEDGYVESEEDYTYYVPEQGSVTVIPPQIIMTGGIGGGSRGSESEDPSKDILYV